MTTRERMSIPVSFNKLQLIKLVHARPALWDKTRDSYRRKLIKDAAWHEICRIMKKDYDNVGEMERQNFNRWVGKIWRHIRDSWARSINARKKAKKSGGSVRPYKYDYELAFLKKVKGPTSSPSKDEGNTEDEEDKEDGDNGALHEEKHFESGSDSVPAWDHEYECTDDNTDDEWNADSKEGIITTINYDNATNEINSNDNATNEINSNDNVTNEINSNDNATNEINSTVKREDNGTTENIIDSKITMFLDQMQEIKKASDLLEDRHYAFFKSVHPSLTSLNDDQVLEFQLGVINLLRNIKRRGRLTPCSSSSRGYNLQPEAPIVSQQPEVAPRVTQNISSGSAGSSRTQLELDPLQTD